MTLGAGGAEQDGDDGNGSRMSDGTSHLDSIGERERCEGRTFFLLMGMMLDTKRKYVLDKAIQAIPGEQSTYNLYGNL